MTEAFKRGFLDTLVKIAQDSGTTAAASSQAADAGDIVEKPKQLKTVPLTKIPKWNKYVPWPTLDEKTRASEEAFNKHVNGLNYNRNMYYNDDVDRARAFAAIGEDPSKYLRYHGASNYDFMELEPKAYINRPSFKKQIEAAPDVSAKTGLIAQTGLPAQAIARLVGE
jgi:hypothetical protein